MCVCVVCVFNFVFLHFSRLIASYVIGVKQHKIKSVQNLANEILKLSAPQKELNQFEIKVKNTLQQWDDVCSMVGKWSSMYTLPPEIKCCLLNLLVI